MKVLFVEAEETFYMSVSTKIPKRWAYLGEIATYIAKENDVKVMDCINPQISHAEILNEIANDKYELVWRQSEQCVFWRMTSVVRIFIFLQKLE